MIAKLWLDILISREQMTLNSRAQSNQDVLWELCSSSITSSSNMSQCPMQEMVNPSSINLSLIHVEIKTFIIVSPDQLCRFASSECWEFNLQDVLKQRTLQSYLWHAAKANSHTIVEVIWYQNNMPWKMITTTLWLIWQARNGIIEECGDYEGIWLAKGCCGWC